jgi:hypothetical protein
MRVIFLRGPEHPGKETGSQGRWRGNPRIQLDLPQLSQRLYSSQYGRKVRSSFCVLSRAKMQRSLEQRYAIKFIIDKRLWTFLERGCVIYDVNITQLLYPCNIQGDEKVSIHLMITIQNATWLNLTAWQRTVRARGTLDSH